MKKKTFWIVALVALSLTGASAVASAATRHGGGRGGFHGSFHGGWGGGFYRPYFGFGWGYPAYYGGYYGYYPGSYGSYGSYGYASARWAAVKTDVEPEEARVYLDGQYIGTADDFDGFPDKLYLRPGRYRLEFRLSGYEPKVLDLSARAGMLLRVDDKLRRGGDARVGNDPPKLEGDVQRFFAKRSQRDVARPYLRRDGDEDRRGYREGDGDNNDVDVDGNRRLENGNDRNVEDDRNADVDRDSDRDRNRDERAPAARPDDDWRRGDRRPDVSVSARPEAKRDRGRLKISVEPSDAVVYVDDRFVGSADEVSSMDRGIVVSPGKHTVTVSRPGYRDKASEVVVEVGKTETVTISLGR